MPQELGLAMVLIARVAADAGDADAAATLLGASYALRKQTGGELASPEQTIHDSAQLLTADTLGKDGYRSAFELGTRTSVNGAIDLATGCLRDGHPDAAVG